MSQWKLGEVRDGSWDDRGGLGRVGGPSRKSGTGWGTIGVVRDGSGETPRGPGLVEGTHREVRV